MKNCFHLTDKDNNCLIIPFRFIDNITYKDQSDDDIVVVETTERVYAFAPSQEVFDKNTYSYTHSIIIENFELVKQGIWDYLLWLNQDNCDCTCK